ncbi:MAG: putative sensor protein [Actinomycetia bacterium]|nr:putative sensor protein [Actinomycetes bacterium]
MSTETTAARGARVGRRGRVPRVARVVVADPSSLSRAKVRSILEQLDRVAVVGGTGDGPAALDVAIGSHADIVCCSVHLPRLSGLHLLTRVRAALPESVVVVASHLSEIASLADEQRLASDLACALGAVPSDADGRTNVDLPCAERSAADAREFVEQELRRRGRVALAGPAMLLASEIVTNAVVHARSPACLSISELGATLRIEVTDWGGGALVMRPVTPMATGGRGLHILDRGADVWGTVSTPNAKTVWFELADQQHRSGVRRHDG